MKLSVPTGKKMCATLSVWLLLFATVVTAQAQPAVDTLFAAGNEAYLQKDYPAAISNYEQALALEPSAAIHYNLGNAFQASGEAGQAIAHYEKALALKPSLKEAALNLSLVRSTLELPISEATPLSALGNMATLNQWVLIVVIAFWVAVLGYVAPMIPAKWLLWARLSATLAAIAVIIAALGCWHWYGQQSKAVVVLENAPLLASPNTGSAHAAFAERGQYVTIEQELPAFYLVQTEMGKSGFVSKTAIKKIWQ